MRIFLLLTVLLASSLAHAQFSLQDADGDVRFRLLGKTWNPTMFNVSSTETDMIEQGGRISSYSFITFATWAGDFRYAVRVPFQFNSAGTDRFNQGTVNEQEFFFHDLILSMQKFDVAMIPWDIGLYWEGRVYLPTSENSADQGLIARFRNNFIFSKVFSRYFEMEFDHRFNYFIQSRTVYRNRGVDAEGFPFDRATQTKQIEMQNIVRLWGKITPQTGVGWAIGTDDTYWNKSKAMDRSRPGERNIVMGPQLRFPLTKGTNMIFAYQETTNRDENPDEFGKFLAENTQFSLLSFISF